MCPDDGAGAGTLAPASIEIQNPHASGPLRIPVDVVCNTADEDIDRNIRENASRPLEWVGEQPPHDRPAIMVGGGPSAADVLDEIADRWVNGGTVFAMNGASRWLRERVGIRADYQVIEDAQPETAHLVDLRARAHLFASQVDPDTMGSVQWPTVWHLYRDGIEALFPAERVRRGGYSLIGSGVSVGNSALCLAYVMGYRTFHLYGYDSSHRDGQSHAYRQPMNDGIPCMPVEFGGKAYFASLAMRAQAERFLITARDLMDAGATLHVHGDGLLPAMFHASSQKGK